MKDLAIWIAIWIGVWGFYNLSLRWFTEIYGYRKFVPRGLFFLISFLVTYFIFQPRLTQYLPQLIVAFAISNYVGLIISINEKLHKQFTKDRFFMLFQTFDILFQQTSILILIQILDSNIKQGYADIYLGMFFFVIHSPILLFRWVKYRFLIVLLSFVGGWIFSYLILNIRYGIIYSFIIHFFIYVLMIYYVKDEEKI